MNFGAFVTWEKRARRGHEWPPSKIHVVSYITGRGAHLKFKHLHSHSSGLFIDRRLLANVLGLKIIEKNTKIFHHFSKSW